MASERVAASTNSRSSIVKQHFVIPGHATQLGLPELVISISKSATADLDARPGMTE